MYYLCEWLNGYSFLIGFLYRAVPADGVFRLRAVLTDGRLLRLSLLLLLSGFHLKKSNFARSWLTRTKALNKFPSLSVMFLIWTVLPAANFSRTSGVSPTPLSTCGMTSSRLRICVSDCACLRFSPLKS